MNYDKINNAQASTIVPRSSTETIVKVAISSWIGTTIEFYDFLLYGTAAALVFGTLFFPASDPEAGALAAFATLAVGYLARPIGGILFGHFGDKLGRKKMLLLTMVLMGSSSVLIGLIPTYQDIGIWAAVFLVLLRLIQGIAVGGEWGGAALIIVEHTGDKKRGLWGSFAQIGAPTGVLLATGILAIMAHLPKTEFLAWGWRIPFLLSVVLLAIGYAVRSRIAESPVFEAARNQKNTVPLPLLDLLRHPGNVLLAMGMGLGAFVIQAVMLIFGLSQAISIGYQKSTILTVQSAGSALLILAVFAAATASDYFGRRPIIIAGALLSAAWAYPMFALINSDNVNALILAVGVGSLAQAAMYGPLVALFAERFRTRNRYTGASLGYQGAALVGAGLTPLLAAALKHSDGGGTHYVSALLAVASLITAICVFAVRETKHTDLGM